MGITSRPESSEADARRATRPVHDALRDWLSPVDIGFGTPQRSFKKDRTQTAVSRELRTSDLLKAFLPSDRSIKKGLIYDRYGHVSYEVDCALCVPQHPSCRTPTRDLILAEGVHAAVEVKPDVRFLGKGGELPRSLGQAASVKSLVRSIEFALRKTPSWPAEAHRIPYIIFAKRVADFRKTVEFMEREKTRPQSMGPT